MKFSILIPSKNGENYIENVILSIIDQDYKNYEIIIGDNNNNFKFKSIIQTYKNKVRFFSDKEIILSSIKYKNKFLSNNIKLNIIKESSNSNLSFKNLKIRKVIINSKEVNKDDIFFTIKGKKNDAHNYLDEVFKKKASIAIVNKFSKK